MEHEIVVRGVGEVRTMPEHATFQVTVEGEGSTREAAFEVASGAAAAVDEVLQSVTGAVGVVIGTALVVQQKTRWHKGESVKAGWRAFRRSVVEIRDIDQTSEILGHVVGAGASVAGLRWEVKDDHLSYDEARVLASHDAKRRASTYADSLGLALGSVLWVSEPGLRIAQSSSEMARGLAGGASPMGARTAGEASIEVLPEEIVVSARIEVGFAFSDAGAS
jgi:uncharacterized protein YggE